MPLGNPRRVELEQLRAALYTDNGILTPTRETIEAVKRAAKSLSDVGVTVEEVRLPGIEQRLELFIGLSSADGGPTYRWRSRCSAPQNLIPCCGGCSI